MQEGCAMPTFPSTTFDNISSIGDSASFDYSAFRGKIDLVFIDASHTYSYVLDDSKIALDLLRKDRGIIIWHDYTSWPGVTQALNELFVKETAFNQIKHLDSTTLAYMIVGC